MEKIINIQKISDDEFLEFGEETLKKIKFESSFYNLLLNQGFNDKDIKNYPSKFDRAFNSYLLNKENITYKKWKNNINSKFMDVIYKDDDGLPELKSIEFDGYKQIVDYSLNFIYNTSVDLNNFFELDLDSILKEDTKESIKSSIKNKNWIFIKGAKEELNDKCVFSTINELIKKENKKIAIINALSDFNKFYSDFKEDKEYFDSILSLFNEADIIYIKNFGKEIPSKIIRDELLIKIFENFNYSSSKTIIFSSNLTLNKICNKYIFKDGSKIEAKTIYDLISNNLFNKKEVNYLNLQ